MTEDPRKPFLLIFTDGNDDVAFLNAIIKHLKNEGKSQYEYRAIGLEGKNNFDANTVSKKESKTKTFIDRLRIFINDPSTSIKELDKPKTWNSELKLTDVTHMLLLQDADQSSESAFNKLKSNFKLLKEEGIQVEDPKNLGVWHAPKNGKKEISFHSACNLLPGPDKEANWREGCLEDLLLDSLDPEQLACIETFEHCHNATKPTEKQISIGVKNKVQAWLSMQSNNKNCSLPVSFEKNHWNLNHSCFDPIKTFLTSIS